MAHEDAKTETPRDPIVDGSLLRPIVVATVILLVSMGWALYDEGFTRRPYKGFQRQWITVAGPAYEAKEREAAAERDRLVAHPDYQALDASLKEAEAAVRDALQRLNDELNKVVQPRLAVLADPVKFVRSEVAALTYEVEHATEKKDEGARQRALSHLAAKKAETKSFLFPGESAEVVLDYEGMVKAFNDLKARQGQIQGELARLTKDAAEKRKVRDGWLQARLTLPPPDAVRRLRASLDEFIVEVKQVHIQRPDGQLIDRCESCHAGIRSPVPLDADDVGGRREFVTHPRPELLEVHDPDSFGCSPCHNGNGIALTSVEKAHGHYKHWLWPLYADENREAGCIQCHARDVFLEMGEEFSRGRDLFRWRGCWGCHRYEGYGAEWDQLAQAQKDLERFDGLVEAKRIEQQEMKAVTEDPEASEEALGAAYAGLSRNTQETHLLLTEQARSQERVQELGLEVKKVGPNLKEVAAKLRPEWIQPWILNPLAFRPDTKMPEFYVDEQQAWDIAAFLWQSSEPVEPAPTGAGEGDAERGRWLFQVRGCLGCHKAYIEDEGAELGDGFAATLSRMGEKADAAYLASWIRDPRRHNQRTVMPSLRLDDQEAADVAAWLVSLKDDAAVYPGRDEALAVLTDKARFKDGERLVKHLGCAGCHDIKGLENEGRIGTELTLEGSKPIERLDFGLHTHAAKREHWYTHKGFFEHKLDDPQVYDAGKVKETYFDRLKMPNFHLEREPGARDALATLLLGSVDSAVPASMRYAPQGAKKDVQDGWWLIKKYNCEGCHQIRPGETPSLWTLPWYQDGAGFEGVPEKNGRPPTLVGEGSRVSPTWLSTFLGNPALTDDPALFHRNGVRQGLNVRMPTYELSAHERGVLVRFFRGLVDQPTDFADDRPRLLAGEELTVARAAFVAGDCFNCHLLGGEPSIDPANTYAPSFEPVSERVSPKWVYRWVTEPSEVIPGTAMPALLRLEEREEGARWIFDVEKISEKARARLGPELLQQLEAYAGDHAELLRRYFAQFDAVEAEYMKAQRAR